MECKERVEGVVTAIPMDIPIIMFMEVILIKVHKKKIVDVDAEAMETVVSMV